MLEKEENSGKSLISLLIGEKNARASERRKQIGVEVGEKIRLRRESRRMTKKRLAAAVGVSQVHMARLENGEKDLKLWHLYAVADALGCWPEDFL